MEKIKVAEFVGSMNCGGTETMLMNVLRNIDKEKYEIHFIENVSEKCWYDDEIISLGGKIIKLKSKKRDIFKYIKELIKIFQTNKYNVVHSHTYLHSGIIMYAAKKAGVDIRITHSHSNMNTIKHSFVYRIKKLLMTRLILKYSNKFVACSKEAGISLFGKEFEKKGIILHNPIEISKIDNINRDEVNNIKAKYSILSNNQIILGHVGRFIEIKNHKFLVEIAKILYDKNINFKLFLLGDGENFENIRRLVKEYNLENHIIMTGNVKNVYDYMSIMDVFLMPSLYEGLPLTAIEAQASGVNCILSNNISPETDVGLGIVKFLSLSNIQNWIEEILILSGKEKIDKEIIKNKMIEEKYDTNSIIKELEKLYN